MRQRTRAHLEVARVMLAAAELAAGHDDPRTAADRTYFSMLHTASALLVEDGVTPASHGRLIGAFGSRFAKTERLDPVHHRRLMDAFDRRQLADYDPTVTLDSEDIVLAIADAREFLKAATSVLETGRPER